MKFGAVRGKCSKTIVCGQADISKAISDFRGPQLVQTHCRNQNGRNLTCDESAGVLPLPSDAFANRFLVVTWQKCTITRDEFAATTYESSGLNT